MGNNIIDIIYIDGIKFSVRCLKTIDGKDIIIVDYPKPNILERKQKNV